MAASSPTIAFIGRVLFAFLFLSSGFQKLTSFNLSTGGPVMSGMAPKMDTFLKTIDQVAGVQLPVPQVRDLQGDSARCVHIVSFVKLPGYAGLLHFSVGHCHFSRACRRPAFYL